MYYHTQNQEEGVSGFSFLEISDRRQTSHSHVPLFPHSSSNKGYEFVVRISTMSYYGEVIDGVST